MVFVVVEQGKKLFDSTIQPDPCKLLKCMFDRPVVLNSITHAKDRLDLSKYVNLSMVDL